MTEPTGKSGLLPCPICGDDADYSRGGDSVRCDSAKCPLHYAEIYKNAWQALPRVSDAVLEVAGELREIVRYDKCHQNGIGNWVLAVKPEQLERMADRLETAGEPGRCERCANWKQQCYGSACYDLIAATAEVERLKKQLADSRHSVSGDARFFLDSARLLVDTYRTRPHEMDIVVRAVRDGMNRRIVVSLPIHGAPEPRETCSCPWVTHPMVCGHCGKPPMSPPAHDEPSENFGVCALPEQWEAVHRRIAELEDAYGGADADAAGWATMADALEQDLTLAQKMAARYLKACKRIFREWRQKRDESNIGFSSLDVALDQRDDRYKRWQRELMAREVAESERDAARAEVDRLRDGIRDAHDLSAQRLHPSEPVFMVQRTLRALLEGGDQ